MRHCKTAFEAINQLKRETNSTTPTVPIPAPKHLNRKQLSTERSLFNNRDLDGRIAEADQHINDLSLIISDKTNPRMLDPIAVFWSGSKYYCIDGYHRLEAYRLVGISKDIPVVLFVGTVEEAIAEATRLNGKNTLQTTNSDRCNSAWRLTCLTLLSRTKVAGVSGVSERCVSHMRLAKSKLLECTSNSLDDNQDVYELSDIVEMSWDEARRTAKGEDTTSDFDFADARELKAQRLAKALSKVVHNQIHIDPEAFARALQLLDKRLPRTLMESSSWHNDVLETAEDILEEEADRDY